MHSYPASPSTLSPFEDKGGYEGDEGVFERDGLQMLASLGKMDHLLMDAHPFISAFISGHPRSVGCVTLLGNAVTTVKGSHSIQHAQGTYLVSENSVNRCKDSCLSCLCIACPPLQERNMVTDHGTGEQNEFILHEMHSNYTRS